MLDKKEVARHQLGAALALYLDDVDPVVVHCLACGGGEVAEHLAGKAGTQPFSKHMLAANPDVDARYLRGLRNRYWNAFKHATARDGQDREDEDLLRDFSDEQNDHAQFIGWWDYGRAADQLPWRLRSFSFGTTRCIPKN